MQPFIQKQNIGYHLAIYVVVRIACTLLLDKVLIYDYVFEIFVFDNSIDSSVVRDTCRAIIMKSPHEIAWTINICLFQVQIDLKLICGFPAVVGAIDGTHNPKPKGLFSFLNSMLCIEFPSRY